MSKNNIGYLLTTILVFYSQPIFAEIIIFGLEDFKLGKWVQGVGSLRSNANICVSVRPRGPYQVTAYGTGALRAFTLTNGADTLPYRMFFNDRPRPNGANELLPGQTLGGLRGLRRGIRARQCNRPTANIGILVSDTDLMATSSGTYSGTLIIVVGPE